MDLEDGMDSDACRIYIPQILPYLRDYLVVDTSDLIEDSSATGLGVQGRRRIKLNTFVDPASVYSTILTDHLVDE